MSAEHLLNPGYERNGFFLLRGPVVLASIDTLLTGANMNRSLRQLKAADALAQFAEVGTLNGMRICVFGQDTTNYTATVTLYGWKHFLAPASLIGQVTAQLGNAKSEDRNDATPGWHTDAALDDQWDKRVREAMSVDEDWFACDQYAQVSDVGGNIEVFGPDAVGSAECPAWIEVDLSRTQYQYVALMFTGVGGGGSEMTKATALYSPLNAKLGLAKIAR